MRSSAGANRPRWRGQAPFFGIWLLIVFAPAVRRAWWLRYTTFAPAAGRDDLPCATPRAAAFAALDLHAPGPLPGVRYVPSDATA